MENSLQELTDNERDGTKLQMVIGEIWMESGGHR